MAAAEWGKLIAAFLLALTTGLGVLGVERDSCEAERDAFARTLTTMAINCQASLEALRDGE